jgi:transposase-like protein
MDYRNPVTTFNLPGGEFGRATAEKLAAAGFTVVGVDRSEDGLKELPDGIRREAADPTEVFPETREQRCWWHKIGNVLNALPKSAQPGAKKALAEIWNAEDKDHAQAAANVFAADYGTKGSRSSSDKTRLIPRGLTHADIGI